MSKYIDAELYVEMQIYDDEHEDWKWWKGTIEDLLDQWTEEGCPTTIEVSEDCISREYMKSLGYINKGDFNSVETIREWIDNAPSVVPQVPSEDCIGDCNICRFAGCSECDDCINGSQWVRMTKEDEVEE